MSQPCHLILNIKSLLLPDVNWLTESSPPSSCSIPPPFQKGEVAVGVLFCFRLSVSYFRTNLTHFHGFARNKTKQTRTQNSKTTTTKTNNNKTKTNITTQSGMWSKEHFTYENTKCAVSGRAELFVNFSQIWQLQPKLEEYFNFAFTSSSKWFPPSPQVDSRLVHGVCGAKITLQGQFSVREWHPQKATLSLNKQLLAYTSARRCIENILTKAALQSTIEHSYQVQDNRLEPFESANRMGAPKQSHVVEHMSAGAAGLLWCFQRIIIYVSWEDNAMVCIPQGQDAQHTEDQHCHHYLTPKNSVVFLFTLHIHIHTMDIHAIHEVSYNFLFTSQFNVRFFRPRRSVSAKH